MKVYISGPITGYDLDERRRTFDAMERRLRTAGHDVFNPMRNGLPADARYDEHMRADIKALTDCDVILLLNDWTRSQDCNIEYHVAVHCGIAVYLESFVQDLLSRHD